MYRSLTAAGNGNLGSGRNTDSTVLQEDPCRPGGSIRTTYHNGQRPCSSYIILWTELDIPDQYDASGWINMEEVIYQIIMA